MVDATVLTYDFYAFMLPSLLTGVIKNDSEVYNKGYVTDPQISVLFILSLKTLTTPPCHAPALWFCLSTHLDLVNVPPDAPAVRSRGLPSSSCTFLTSLHVLLLLLMLLALVCFSGFCLRLLISHWIKFVIVTLVSLLFWLRFGSFCFAPALKYRHITVY